MLNFAKLKTFIVQCDLETETKTFKAIDLKSENNFDVFTLYSICSHMFIYVHICSLFFDIEK